MEKMRLDFIGRGQAIIVLLASIIIFSSASLHSSNSLKILFDGDSLTSGGIDEKYRVRHIQGRMKHPHTLLGQSHAYLAAAKLTRYNPKSEFGFVNVAELGMNVERMCSNLMNGSIIPKEQPDVVSILIGINDIWPTIGHPSMVFDAAVFESRLSSCVKSIKSQGKADLTVMLGLPTVFNCGSMGHAWNEWQEKLYRLHNAIRAVAAKHHPHCVVVDFHNKFQSEIAQYAQLITSGSYTADKSVTPDQLVKAVWDSWSGDGVHPTPVGHHLMAEVWLQAFLKDVLPKYYSSGNNAAKAARNVLPLKAMPVPYVFNVSAGSSLTPPYHARKGGSEKVNAVIFYEGDSITDGFRDKGRKFDYLYAIGQGFPLILTGFILSKYPTQLQHYGINNNGVNGDLVANVESRWSHLMQTYKPWIVHLLVGINDIRSALISFNQQMPYAALNNNETKGKELDAKYGNHFVNYDALEEAYDRMFSLCRRVNPQGTVIIGTPFAYPGAMTTMVADRNSIDAMNDHWIRWHHAIKSVGVLLTRLGHKYGFPVINYQSVFDGVIASTNSYSTLWVADGIHPTPAGHHIIAEEILRVINNVYQSQLQSFILRLTVKCPELHY